jgi:hypothetical protein
MWSRACAIVPIMETRRGTSCCIPLKVRAQFVSVMVITNKHRTKGLVFGDAPASTLILT